MAVDPLDWARVPLNTKLAAFASEELMVSGVWLVPEAVTTVVALARIEGVSPAPGRKAAMSQDRLAPVGEMVMVGAASPPCMTRLNTPAMFVAPFGLFDCASRIQLGTESDELESIAQQLPSRSRSPA